MSNSVDPDDMNRLIWIYAVCKNLLLSPVAVKELSICILLNWHSDSVGTVSALCVFVVCSIPGRVNNNDFNQSTESADGGGFLNFYT